MIEEAPGPDDFDSYSHISKNVDSVILGIAIIHVITGLLTFPLVYVIFSSMSTQGPVFYIFMMMVEGAVLGVTIPIYIVIGISIWRVQPWVWKLAVIANAIFLVLNIFGAVILTAILNIIILLSLNNEDVKLALQPNARRNW